MSVKYNVIERANPADRQAPKKFYPSIVSSGRLTVRQLAAEAASMSTLSSADLAAALEIFLTIIPKELAKGNIVELGDFGSFWLKNNAEGCDTAEEVRASHITGLQPRFNPGKEFKKVLDAIEFEKA
jgi:predicted histone-like DNA-binding protein